MPLEDLTGPSKFINALNSLNPDGATDRINEGDDHLRGIKNVLLNTFPAITAAITDTAAEINTWAARIAALEVPLLTPAGQNPIGTIKMTTDNTNPGTYITGTTWVQIAQGRTLVGEGTGVGLTARVAGAEIGSEDTIVPMHNHTITDPGHRHDSNIPQTASSSGAGGASGDPGGPDPKTSSETTGITIDNEGVDPTDTNLQPSLVVYIWERTA